MIRLTLAALADHAIKSSDGKLTLETDPSETDHLEHEILIRCIDQGGQDLFDPHRAKLTIRQAVPGQAVRIIETLRIENLKLQTYGGHSFLIFIDGNLKETITLDIAKPRDP